jgi:peptide/nickel transport system permease protein
MGFRRYLLKRLALSVLTLFGVVLAVFVMTRVLPGDPASVKGGQYANAEAKAEIRRQMGLDKPLVVQFTTYLGNAVRGDLGESARSGRPVREDIAGRLPATLELALYSLLFAAIVGIPLGMYAAVHRGSRRDAAIQQLAIFSAAMPVFWLGLVAIYLLYHHWNIAPAPVGRLSTSIDPPRDITGLYTIDALFTLNVAALRDAAGHLVLPVLTLGFIVMSSFIKMSRSAMVTVLASDYVLAARSLGLGNREILWQDALKNGMIQLLTVAGIVLGYLLAGNVLVESLFAWPGLGFYAWTALTGSDYDAIQGFVLVIAVIYVVLNLAVDIAYTVIDPRIRLA